VLSDRRPLPKDVVGSFEATSLSDGAVLRRAPGIDGAGVRTEIPPTANSGNGFAYQTKTFENARGLHVEFDVRIDAAKLELNSSNFAIADIASMLGKLRAIVYLSNGTPNAFIYTDGRTSTDGSSAALRLNIPSERWIHLTMDVLSVRTGRSRSPSTARPASMHLS